MKTGKRCIILKETMMNTVMHMKFNKKKFLLIPILFIFIFTSCNKKEDVLKTNKSSTEIVKKDTSNMEKGDVSNTKVEQKKNDDSYKHRDDLNSLISAGKIFNLNIDEKNNYEDLNLYVTLENDKTILKDLEIIKIGLSVQELKDETQTGIHKFDKSKNYWEIKLDKGNLETIYDINISERTNLLTDKEKELLKNKKKDFILRFDIFVDEGNPVKIHNHFLN